MPKKIFYAIVFLILATSNFSCSKWLTLQPQDGITQNEFWKTKEQLQSAVIGCYSSLLTGSDRQLAEYLFMWGETRGDMIVTTLAASNDEQDIVNVNTQATNSVVQWSAPYKTINYCNDVIKNAPGVLAADNTLTQTQLNQWMSEVYTLRALMYFYLVRSFRDVPLKLTPTSSDADLQQLPKSSDTAVLAQVLKDLSFADSNAVFSYGNLAFNKGRVTRYTAYAIEADVNLWLNNYDATVANCNKIINSGQFALVPNNSGWFTNLYYNGNSSESIFEFQYDQQALNSFYTMFLSNRRYAAAGRVMDEIFTIDPLNDANKDIRGDGVSVRSADNAIWKYVSIDYNSPRASNASYAHWFVYRYSDILLMKAEALNEKGDGANALPLIYTIRRRANALDATDLRPDSTDRRGIQDFILAERQREFAFEGKRWYDALRFAKRNNYERLDVLLTLVGKTASSDRQQSAISKYKGDPNTHYFPIYFNELLTDKNLVQNPYYK